MLLPLIDPTQAIRWTHPVEKGAPEDQKVRFWIRPLTQGESRRLSAIVESEAGEAKGGGVAFRNYALNLFLAQVERIENVRYPGGGDPVTVETRDAKMYFLDHLPLEMWPAIYAAIEKYSALQEGTEKN